MSRPRVLAESTVLPPSEVIVSPATMPAFAAGSPETTPPTRAPAMDERPTLSWALVERMSILKNEAER